MRRLAFALALLLALPALGANEVNWNIGGVALTTLEDGDLDALADGEQELTAGQNNTVHMDRFAAFALTIDTQGAGRDPGAWVGIWILPSLDGGATYTTGADGAGVDPNTPPDCIIPLDAVVTARYEICWNVPIPPLFFKVLIENNTGQAFKAAAATNELEWLTYNEEIQ